MAQAVAWGFILSEILNANAKELKSTGMADYRKMVENELTRVRNKLRALYKENKWPPARDGSLRGV